RMYNISSLFVAKWSVLEQIVVYFSIFYNIEGKEAGYRQQLLHFLQHLSTAIMDSFFYLSIYSSGNLK
ncbi:hypothetical protein, partial [Paenibacillus alginolyticus]